MNLLTFDLEDWYQLSGERLGAPGEPQPARLERQLGRLLELLTRHGVHATFFCLGRSLVASPHLVRRVMEAGHEISTHGWGHGLIHQIGLEAFREDLKRAIAWLSDLTGRAILGYRAPAFSVSAEQLEGFYDICVECGLRYDSSVFPFRGGRYGIEGAPRRPHVVRDTAGHTLTEFPLATVEWFGRRWAIAGGGWWRMMPAAVIRAAVAKVNHEGLPFTTYFHPYEFDSERLDAFVASSPSLAALKWGIKQNLGRSSVYEKLDRVLTEFPFGSVEEFLHGSGSF